MQSNDNIIILGDFNAPDIDWLTLSADSGFSIQLCDLNNLTQVITSSTHEHGNILDLVITNNEEIISDISIHSKNELLIKSDHYPVSCKLTFCAPGNNHKADQKSIQIYDYSTMV